MSFQPGCDAVAKAALDESFPLENSPSPSRICRNALSQSPDTTPSESLGDAPKKHLPCPLVHSIQKLRKRKLSPASNGVSSGPHNAKKSRVSSEHPAQDRQDLVYHPVAYWTKHFHWPHGFSRGGFDMDGINPKNRTKNASTRQSAYFQRLAANRVFMRPSALMQNSSQELYEKLLNGNTKISQCMPFPEDRFLDILYRAQFLNKSRVQRDITPWVVPSAEQLHFCGEADLEYIADEVCSFWSACATLGLETPKPYYTAGLQLCAFTPTELAKLRMYSVPEKPAFFTPQLCFPFLICEVKSVSQGWMIAEQQSMHSGSIAVRAVIELYRTAFGDDSPKTKDLSGKVLVFTVSHDHDTVRLHCHYGVLQTSSRASDQASQSWEFYREVIDIISLSGNGGRDKYKPHKFVRNVYQHFAPQHLQRIKEATSELQDVAPQTQLPSTTADISLYTSESQQESEDMVQLDNPTTFETSSVPVEIRQAQETEQEIKGLNNRIDALLGHLERQRLRNEQQLSQQRSDTEKQLVQRRDEHEKQLAQQRDDHEKQLAQLQDVIALLRK